MCPQVLPRSDNGVEIITQQFLAVHICISLLWLILNLSQRYLSILLIFISVGQLPLKIFLLGNQVNAISLVQINSKFLQSFNFKMKYLQDCPYEQYSLFALYIYIILMNEYFQGTIRINNQITKLTLVKSIIDTATVIDLW